MNEMQIRILMLRILGNIIMSNGITMLASEVIVVDGLVSTTVRMGGRDCHHQPNSTNQWWNAMSNVSYWDWTIVNEADRVENHGNKFHVGCQLDYDIEQIDSALYVVEWQVNRLPKITISNKISENEINLLGDRLEDQFGRVVRAQTVS
jgi:hypothetical protein